MWLVSLFFCVSSISEFLSLETKHLEHVSVLVLCTHQVFRVQVQYTTVLPASMIPVNSLSTVQVSINNLSNILDY